MLLTLAIAAALLHRLDVSSMAALEHQVAAYTTHLTIVRLGLIGAFALLWPALQRFRQRLGHIDVARVAALTAVRWRIVVWLLIIELLVGQNLVGHTLSAFKGTVA